MGGFQGVKGKLYQLYKYNNMGNFKIQRAKNFNKFITTDEIICESCKMKTNNAIEVLNPNSNEFKYYCYGIDTNRCFINNLTEIINANELVLIKLIERA